MSTQLKRNLTKLFVKTASIKKRAAGEAAAASKLMNLVDKGLFYTPGIAGATGFGAGLVGNIPTSWSLHPGKRDFRKLQSKLKDFGGAAMMGGAGASLGLGAATGPIAALALSRGASLAPNTKAGIALRIAQIFGAGLGGLAGVKMWNNK